MLTITLMGAYAREGATFVVAWTRPDVDAALDYGIERALPTSPAPELVEREVDLALRVASEALEEEPEAGGRLLAKAMSAPVASPGKLRASRRATVIG